MAMTWDNVELVRNAQASARKRFEASGKAVQEQIQNTVDTAVAKELGVPHITELESMLFRLRTELIDYIVAHGLVDGLIWNGVLQPVDGGKIVITRDMLEEITRMLGYFTEADLQAFLEAYLPENFYVRDQDYIHTDNNYTDEEKDKLSGIATGAEVDKVISILFNGTETIDADTRVATIDITPDDIKRWYEANDNTNAFTDAEKEKLAGVSSGAEVNRVDDVLVDARSVLNDKKQAIITKEIIKESYESNENTNAFTDAEKLKIQTNETRIKTNEADINALKTKADDVADSVSELGDEVNSIAGRVTTSETEISANTAKIEAVEEKAKSHRKQQIISGALTNILDFEQIPTENGKYFLQFPVRVKETFTDGESATREQIMYGVVDVTSTELGTYLINGRIETHNEVNIIATFSQREYYEDITGLISYAEIDSDFEKEISEFSQIEANGLQEYTPIYLPQKSVKLSQSTVKTITSKKDSEYNNFVPEANVLYYIDSMQGTGSIRLAPFCFSFLPTRTYEYITVPANLTPITYDGGQYMLGNVSIVLAYNSVGELYITEMTAVAWALNGSEQFATRSTKLVFDVSLFEFSLNVRTLVLGN